jgi:2-phosphosulfolactate phosphatase
VPDTSLVYVHSLPVLIEPGGLRGVVAIVVDVLRATTVMVHALDAGAEAILPCLEVEDAITEASRYSTGKALLAGERQGLPIEGFDLGNSPGAFVPGVCAGKTVVMTTTNGTRAIHASLDAKRVLIASFLNLSATIDAVQNDGLAIHLVCSGTNGLISFEDNLLAGAMVQALRARGRSPGNDEARLAEMAWSNASKEPLVDVLSRGAGGQRVTEIGLAADIKVAGAVDRMGLVVEVVRNPIRVVKVKSQR